MVFCPLRGELLPPQNKLVGGSAIRVIIKMSRGHDRWIWERGTENNGFSSLVCFWGAVPGHGSATQKQTKPASRLDRRAGSLVKCSCRLQVLAVPEPK